MRLVRRGDARLSSLGLRVYAEGWSSALRAVSPELSRSNGGGRQRVELSEGEWLSRATPDEIVSLDESLSRLAEDDAASAEIVKLRLFAGISVDEAARCLGLSRASAYRHWAYARAWLVA